jgi:hypothetical protein
MKALTTLNLHLNILDDRGTMHLANALEINNVSNILRPFFPNENHHQFI